MRVSLLSLQSGTSCDQWDSRVTAAEYLQQVCVAVTFTPFQTSVVVDSCGGYTRQLSDTYKLVSELERGTKSPDEGTRRRENVTSFEAQFC